MLNSNVFFATNAFDSVLSGSWSTDTSTIDLTNSSYGDVCMMNYSLFDFCCLFELKVFTNLLTKSIFGRAMVEIIQSGETPVSAKSSNKKIKLVSSTAIYLPASLNLNVCVVLVNLQCFFFFISGALMPVVASLVHSFHNSVMEMRLCCFPIKILYCCPNCVWATLQISSLMLFVWFRWMFFSSCLCNLLWTKAVPFGNNMSNMEHVLWFYIFNLFCWLHHFTG